MGTERLDGTDRHAVLPLVEGALRVGKRRVGAGRVRVPIRTEAGERLVRETPRAERAEIEPVAAGREFAGGEETSAARREGDGTVVLPVPEEVLVVERRLVLREEVRLRLVAAEGAVEQPVTLRRQRAEVKRLPASADDVGPRHAAGPAP